LDLISTSSSFEFSAETWTKLRAEVDEEREMVLGWLHTHSLEFIQRNGDDAAGETPGPDHWPEAQDDSTREGKKQRLHSGLFISALDLESALKRGFGAAYHLTCVLDSDACTKVEKGDINLREILGVWGWHEGMLRRRSIQIIQDGDVVGRRFAPDLCQDCVHRRDTVAKPKKSL
jgi:hypothetical protein